MDEFVFVPCVLRIRFHTNTTYMFSNSNMDNMNIVCGGGRGSRCHWYLKASNGWPLRWPSWPWPIDCGPPKSCSPAGNGPSIAAHLSHADPRLNAKTSGPLWLLSSPFTACYAVTLDLSPSWPLGRDKKRPGTIKYVYPDKDGHASFTPPRQRGRPS
jgi:hypothetical protein